MAAKFNTHIPQSRYMTIKAMDDIGVVMTPFGDVVIVHINFGGQ